MLLSVYSIILTLNYDTVNDHLSVYSIYNENLFINHQVA